MNWPSGFSAAVLLDVALDRASRDVHRLLALVGVVVAAQEAARSRPPRAARWSGSAAAACQAAQELSSKPRTFSLEAVAGPASRTAHASRTHPRVLPIAHSRNGCQRPQHRPPGRRRNADGLNRRRLSRSTRPLPGKPPCPNFARLPSPPPMPRRSPSFASPGSRQPRRPLPVRLNRELAEELGVDLDLLAGPEGLAMFAGNLLPAGAKPVAQAYAGHQFGGFSPRLGDGRALLLGEVVDRQGRRRDIAFKGSGRTPFSRNGDGKRAGSGAARIPGRRGDARARHPDHAGASSSPPATWCAASAPCPAPCSPASPPATCASAPSNMSPCITARLLKAARRLRHRPPRPTTGRPRRPLPGAARRRVSPVASRTGRPLARGRLHPRRDEHRQHDHLSGETIDYGSCAFLESYHPRNRVQLDRQPGPLRLRPPGVDAQWNLARLAETLLPLIDTDMTAPSPPPRR